MTAWKLLPNISHWVLQTIQKGYQIRVSPAQVHGGIVHRGGPPAGSDNGTGNKNSVRERGHRICNSRYFIVLKKDGGLRPILDLRVLNESVTQLKFKMLTLQNITDQIRELVCYDRTQGRILSHIHPSMSQEIPEVRFWGQSIPVSGSSIRLSNITPHFHEMRNAALVLLWLQGIHIMNYINDWLILAQSHQLGVWHRDVVLSHMKELGVTAKRQEKCAFSTTEDHFPGRGMGLNVDAGTPCHRHV